jgi:hypothetical protein
MSTIIKTVVSRVKNQVKGVRQDAFLTDRYVYSVVLKYAQVLMRRQDSANKLMKFNSIWQTLPCVELIDIDKIEACCAGIKSGCLIKRTKEKLPTFMEGYWGPLIRTVASIDGSVEMFGTTPGIYTSMSKSKSFKYNNNKYFWFLNGYLYFPNIDWDAVKIEGVFTYDVSTIGDNKVSCVKRQNQQINIPEFLFAEIEKMAIGDLMQRLQIPTDMSDDNINVNR